MMSGLKPKDPLVALMLGFVTTGLGQIYCGRIKRGILFFFIPILSSLFLIW